jgi:hypothetical protein
MGTSVQNEGSVAAVNATSKMQVLKAPAAKPRIDCIDGCRFALVLPIVIGHFVKYGVENKFLLKLLTQENVLVGGFFIISGYVSGYVATNLGERSANEKRLAAPELFFWQKVMGYYPLHFLVSTIFAPMYIMTDRWFKNAWSTTGLHAFLNYTLLQAWFPSEAEIWNPPTWFLSALTFANVTMPTFVLPQVSRLSKDGLSKLGRALTVVSVLQKMSYSMAWTFFCKGGYVTKPSSPHLWNVTRFHPFSTLVEVVLGITAVRDVMLDSPEDRIRLAKNPLWFFLASYSALALRLTRFNLNDAMIRSLLFVPLFSRFLKAMHRDCVSDRPHLITRFFGSSLMARLGSLAFPMFILHGPIGQLFYKKAIATRLWGRVMPKSFFPIWLMLVMLASHLVNEGFVKSKTVQTISANLAKQLASLTQGFLQDKQRDDKAIEVAVSKP